MSDAVPLPEHLAHCGCPHAPNLHLVTCRPAIEFDETPFHEKPGYEEGRSMRAVSWDYPVEVTGTFRVDVMLDPVGVILARYDEYRSWEPDDYGYEPWEKPMLYLTHLIAEELEGGGVYFGGRRLSHDLSSVDELDLRKRGEVGRDRYWNEEDTARLEAELAAKYVDPNQPTLGLTEGTTP